MMTMYIEIFQSYQTALAKKKKSHMRGRGCMHDNYLQDDASQPQRSIAEDPSLARTDVPHMSLRCVEIGKLHLTGFYNSPVST